MGILVQQYNKARIEVELIFTGLPYASALLVKSLINKANPETGLVENITYRDLATLLTVDAAPGRKDSGTPQKQTIRSYLRTIETQCGDHFQVISEGQSLQIKFLTLPEIYASHFKTREVYTDGSEVRYTLTPLVSTNENAIIQEESSTEEDTQPYTDSYTASINVRVKETKTNKQKQTNLTNESNLNFKQGIADDFTPSQSLINTALARGLEKVTDVAEIKKFVLYNQAKCTKWVDYEPIFLAWLERDAEHERASLSRAEHIKNQQKKSMGAPYECHRYKTKASGKTTQSREFVRGGDDIKVFSDNNGFGEEHQLVVGSNECNVRETFHIGSRCP